MEVAAVQRGAKKPGGGLQFDAGAAVSGSRRGYWSLFKLLNVIKRNQGLGQWTACGAVPGTPPPAAVFPAEQGRSAPRRPSHEARNLHCARTRAASFLAWLATDLRWHARPPALRTAVITRTQPPIQLQGGRPDRAFGVSYWNL